MTTYRGDEIPKPDRLDEDLKIVGARLGGMENVEEELNLPPSAEPDYLPKPGQKHYMETEPMAGQMPAPSDWPREPAQPEPGASRRGGFGSIGPSLRPPPKQLDPGDEELSAGRFKQGGAVQTADKCHLTSAGPTASTSTRSCSAGRRLASVAHVAQTMPPLPAPTVSVAVVVFSSGRRPTSAARQARRLRWQKSAEVTPSLRHRDESRR
jgi:hypothetical protein